MRITRKTLLRLAEQAVFKRTQGSHDIEAIYLTGALAHREDPLLGGTADIDLVILHRASPAQRVERVALSPDVHLDIIHRSLADYEPLRALREHPLLGPELYAPQVLFKTGFFFDRAQAALLSDYHAPQYALARARQLLDAARAHWFDLQATPHSDDPQHISRYLQAVEQAGNALVALDGGPLLGARRLLDDFTRRATALGQEAHIQPYFSLLGHPIPREKWADLLSAWEAAFQAALMRGAGTPTLHIARKNYFLKGMQAQLQGTHPQTARWPLLSTWTEAIRGLEPDLDLRQQWAAALHPLGLLGEALAKRLDQLDAFLDALDILCEEIATRHGLG